MKNWLFVCLLVAGVVWQSTAQISINAPIDGAVYQRSTAAAGTIPIAGTFENLTGNKIEARLRYAASQAVVPNFDWKVIQLAPTLGHFSSTLTNVPPGWYILDIQVKQNNAVLASSSVNRVGIGEVFVASGQSNAQGYVGYGSVSASDERVRVFNFYDNLNTNVPKYPSFTQLQASSKIALMGHSAWCYGRLGDLLSARLNMPVAFFNGALFGTHSQNWEASANNQPTFFFWNGAQIQPLGAPYMHLKNILQFYAQNFGVRSVLWHQGESDNDINTPTTDYFNRLSFIINKTRTDFNPNLSWVVSRVSFSNGNTDQNVIDAQNLTIQNTANTFAGPETDFIQPRLIGDPNGDNVHFYDQSLLDLGSAWDAALSQSFFNNSSPTPNSELLSIGITCQSGSQLLTAPTGFSSYKWVRVDANGNDYNQAAFSTTNTLQVTTGTYRCYAIQSNGAVRVSSLVNVDVSNAHCNAPLQGCSSDVQLSTLTITNSTNGLGPIELNRNNGGATANDGNIMQLNGEVFTKGIGVYGNSTITFSLNSSIYDRLKGTLGIDDEVTSTACGAVKFRVLGDGNVLFESTTATATTPNITLDIPIAGVSTLQLVVDALGNEQCDMANWANIRLTQPTSTIYSPVVSLPSNPMTVNTGTTVPVTATGCSANTFIRWSTGHENTSTINVQPTTTSNYFAQCVDTNGCVSYRSNEVTVNVIPPCEEGYSFISPYGDINSTYAPLTYQSSTLIEASNKINSGAKVNFRAPNSIDLNPGFEAKSGSVFTASIGGCAN